MEGWPKIVGNGLYKEVKFRFSDAHTRADGLDRVIVNKDMGVVVNNRSRKGGKEKC